MNEQERADWLARALDNLIHGRREPDPPPDLDDSELSSLIRVASARLESASIASQAGLQHEGEVWRKVLQRLDRRRRHAETGDTAQDAAAQFGFDRGEFHELQDIVLLRRRMADEIRAFAETQRDSVWRAIKSRIEARSHKHSLLRFLRRHKPGSQTPIPAFESIAVGQTVWQSRDSRTAELVDLARKRRVLGQMAQQSASASEHRVWARIQPSIYSVVLRDARPAGPSGRQPFTRPAWSRLAAAAAAAALLVAAVGPIPATGLAHHPAVRLAEYVGSHVGVSETTSPPGTSTTSGLVQGTPSSPEDASRLLGVPVSEPSLVPPGFTLAASTYYPHGISGTGGVFLLTYSSADATLMVFQEAAGGDDLAAMAGAALDVTLADGTPATYVQGNWLPGPGGFTWTQGGAQTLVFVRDGVRTTVQYTGPTVEPSRLIEVASSIR